MADEQKHGGMTLSVYPDERDKINSLRDRLGVRTQKAAIMVATIIAHQVLDLGLAGADVDAAKAEVDDGA